MTTDKLSKPSLRQAHEARLTQQGWIEPLQRLSAAETAALEARGFDIIRQDLASTWGEFGTLARTSDGRYYLLALA